MVENNINSGFGGGIRTCGNSTVYFYAELTISDPDKVPYLGWIRIRIEYELNWKSEPEQADV
jgi:hypothetical protein